MKKNIIVGQSGGPTAVINASLCGVIREGKCHPEQIGTVYGMINGIEGFLAGKYMDLSSGLNEEELELLKMTPAAFLGSCRFKLPEALSSEFYPTLFNKFEELNIGYFFYIGGNDSMDTVSKLSRYANGIGSDIRFIGIPKTIDNDLIGTDHTPGFGSAAKYVASTVREITLDASVYQQKSVTIVELMGRHAGWLTASSVLARKHGEDNPLLIYLPESPFEFEQFSADLKNAFEKSQTVVVCVSEGIADSAGHFICEYSNEAQLDTFGHKMLTGCGEILENYIRNQFGVKVRSVELNVSQRCSGMIVSGQDMKEAEEAGAFGVRSALDGVNGMMVAFKRACEEPYLMECFLADVNEICNKEKTFPAEWITKGGTDIGPEFLSYVLPLIKGEAERKMENGLPLYLYREQQ
ncbi:6-phosphofructokinase [[Clostridium] symbiosum]|uniref:6-phosphofructokinase n=1 Tax=Clostridium symbiosum TaxID=1512 RepID=UPI00210C67CA|nr:6-phosphofructokinase [[Clostridium] symbiosum]MCQ4834681.1 6-phosphofructokinase [[Clostridium] symbiosum]